jgi:hypothetical protein
MIDIEPRLCEQLIGKQCRNFRFLEGGTLILYFISTDAEAAVGKGLRLWIECAWRLHDGQAVQTGSMDDNSCIINSLQHLTGSTLRSLSFVGRFGDLRLQFANGAVFETFGYSVSSELWELRRPDGLRLGIGPGFAPFERIVGADI